MDKLSQKLGVSFKTSKLIAQALTHSSAVSTYGNYERLEFLGDRVLNLAMAQLLYLKHPNEKEGELSLRHKVMVSQDVLVKVAEEWALADHILFGVGEERSGGRKKPSILADVVESILAVIYMEHGFEVCFNLVEKFWTPLLDHKVPKDPKTHLQEYLQGKGLPLPEYVLVREEGKSPNNIFTISVNAKGYDVLEGKGRSKQQAEQNAAEALLISLGER